MGTGRSQTSSQNGNYSTTEGEEVGRILDPNPARLTRASKFVTKPEQPSAALGRMMILLDSGCVIGMLGVATSRVLSAIVYEATAQDPFVLAAVALTLGRSPDRFQSLGP
jgi:hypothetical protein